MMRDKLEKAARLFRRKFESEFIQEISERDKIEVAFEAGAQWQKENTWIPVEDMEKEDYENDVLVRLEDGSTYRYDEDWEEEMLPVTHYMPIPKIEEGE